MTAEQPNTTRRGFFGTLATLAAVAATPAIASAPDERQAFINTIAFLHQDGSAVAEMAWADGWRPNECYAIIFTCPAAPALMFERNGDRATYRRDGRM